MVQVLQVRYTVSMPMTVTVDLHILSSPHTQDECVVYTDYHYHDNGNILQEQKHLYWITITMVMTIA